MERQYRSIGFFFLSFILFVGLGFYYPYFSLFPHFESVSLLIHIHAISLLLWVVVLVAQPLLISFGKYKTHRIIGKLSYFLFPIVLITSIAVLKQQYNEGIEHNMTASESFKTLYTSGTELLCIVIFYSLALFYVLKGNIAFHMRYMIAMSLLFIPPSFGRTLGYWLNMKQYHTYNISILLCMVILILLIIYDKKRNLNYRPYSISLSVLLVIHLGWFALGHPI